MQGASGHNALREGHRSPTPAATVAFIGDEAGRWSEINRKTGVVVD